MGIFVSLPEGSPFPTNPRVGRLLSRADTGIRPPDTGVNVKIIGEGITSEGTYHLPSDSEIIDLVERAGGLKKGAITSGLDWHQKLYDGLTVTVPTRGVFQKVRSGTITLTNRDLIRFRAYGPNDESSQSKQSSSELLDLNEASELQLQELPGIGDVLAGRIVDYRREKEGFDSVREIRNVFGIGDVTYQELRSRVKVD